MTRKTGADFMRIGRRIILSFSVFLAALLAAHPSPMAQQCDTRAFNAVIDETAQTLRTLNKDSERRFQDRLQAVGSSKKWTEAQKSEKATQAMDDSRLGSFNSEIEQLVSQLDALSAAKGNEITCQRLNEVKTVRDRLTTVMGQKAGFILAQLDSQGVPAPQQNASQQAPKPAPLAPAPAAPNAQIPDKAPDAAPPAKKPQSAWAANLSKVPSANPPPPAPSAPAPVQAAPPPLPPPSTANAPMPLRPQAPSGERYASLPPQPEPAAPMSMPPMARGYSPRDIKEASEGIFGSVTSDLAGVVNYAFKKYGEPNGYIIGNEGGGAFLAGLRYGDGQLYARINGVETGPTKIYWQGPSIGADVGATGSRALFLVYNLDDMGALYRRFPGIDGTAYVAGGVGLTVFQSGNLVIIPIRAGLGLRIGASIAYLKFTERASWNPF